MSTQYKLKKSEMNFQNLDSLNHVVNVVNEAALALSDTTRTISDSSISEVLGGALGAGVGGAASFAALYALGVPGLSAAGLTSGLAAAGALVGGGMTAGLFVLAAPLVILGGVGVSIAAKKKFDQLQMEKERLYKEAMEKQYAIIFALKEEVNADKERIDYLTSLNILLQKAIKDMKHDLAAA